jgi:uncharacterized protein YbaR (Trm112 family)
MRSITAHSEVRQTEQQTVVSCPLTKKFLRMDRKNNQHSGRIIFHRVTSEDLQKVGHTHYFLDESYVTTLPPVA